MRVRTVIENDVDPAFDPAFERACVRLAQCVAWQGGHFALVTAHDLVSRVEAGPDLLLPAPAVASENPHPQRQSPSLSRRAIGRWTRRPVVFVGRRPAFD